MTTSSCCNLVRALRVGMVAQAHQELVCKVGKDFVGRVVSSDRWSVDGKDRCRTMSGWCSTPPGAVRTETALRPAGKRRHGYWRPVSHSADSVWRCWATVNPAQVLSVTQLATKPENTDWLSSPLWLQTTQRRWYATDLFARKWRSGEGHCSEQLSTPLIRCSYIAPHVACAMASICGEVWPRHHYCLRWPYQPRPCLPRSCRCSPAWALAW